MAQRSWLVLPHGEAVWVVLSAKMSREPAGHVYRVHRSESRLWGSSGQREGALVAAVDEQGAAATGLDLIQFPYHAG